MRQPFESRRSQRSLTREHEEIVEHFERAWRQGSPQLIDAFLPATIPPGEASRQLVEELVKIDLEYRWRGSGSEATSCLRLEDYLQQHPQLGPVEQISLDLIGEEYRVRQRWGDKPEGEEYARRFPHLAERLLPFLETIDSEIAAENDPGATPKDYSTLKPVGPKRIRCPHCHNPMQLADEQSDEVLCPVCGSSFRLRDTRQTTTTSSMRQLGKFQLLERVRVGAFGAVWKASDAELDRLVALKIPHPGLLLAPNDLERFYREARAAAQLRHPGIVTVHEVAMLEELPTIVSDFIQGVTLRDLLQVRQMTFREAAELVAQVAEALDYAHSMGLVHRDIKPANIMMEFGPPEVAPGSAGSTEPSTSVAASPKPRPLVMDFGLALRGEAEITMTTDDQIIGTPAYMSPEQAAGRSHQVDCRCDIYSLGVVFYELLTGELPFRGSRQMIVHQLLHDEPRLPRKLNDKIPPDLETICLKCLQKDTRRRYTTARELADDLRRFLAGDPILARPVGKVEQLWRWGRRNRAVAGLLAGILLALFLGVVVVLE